MTTRDLFGMAGANLARRKGRTLLTTVGVVIGVGALVLMVSLGIGLKLQFTKMFESEDLLRTITVTRVDGESSKRPRVGAFGPVGQVIPITEEELKDIRRIAGDAVVYPDLMLFLNMRVPLVEGEPVAAQFVPIGGVPVEEEKHCASILLRGRMWKSGERACLLPSGLLEGRFGRKLEEIDFERPLVLQSAKGSPPEFAIVGIIDSEKLGLKGRQVFMPMSEALELRRITEGGIQIFPYKEGTYPAVEVKVKDPKRVQEVKAKLKNAGYEAMATTDLLEMINTIFLVVEGVFACIGAIGLLVALFGIANTMAMSVLERTREIGIMKALGARARDVRRLFLVEAAWIGAAGGFVGLGGGWAIGKAMNAVARGVLELPDTTRLFHVSPWLVAGSLGFSILVSVIAGLVPAVRAARMDPVRALRYE